MNTAQRQILAMLADLIVYEAEHLRDGMLITDECRRVTARWPVAGRVVILAAGAVVVGHLADVVPYRYDLLAQKFWAARRWKVSGGSRESNPLPLDSTSDHGH